MLYFFVLSFFSATVNMAGSTSASFGSPSVSSVSSSNGSVSELFSFLSLSDQAQTSSTTSA
jgi:hypothetical protein